MQLISLTPWDLALASVLVLVLAASSLGLSLGIGKRVLIAGARTAAQLALVGLILEWVFARGTLTWIALIAFVMLALAGREVSARQERPLLGLWGYGIGTGAMFLSSFVITILALTLVVQNAPWFKAQYSIPLLGMMLGNTMTGIALGLDRLTSGAWRQRAEIEARLALGYSASQATTGLRREAVRSGMIPMLNAMAAAGIISLPGMMTGQILSDVPPWEAVKYQILIMFMICGGTGFGTMGAVWFADRRLFDGRERLRLDRLKNRSRKE